MFFLPKKQLLSPAGLSFLESSHLECEVVWILNLYHHWVILIMLLLECLFMNLKGRLYTNQANQLQKRLEGTLSSFSVSALWFHDSHSASHPSDRVAEVVSLRRKGLLGSWLQKSQSTVTWLCCFGAHVEAAHCGWEPMVEKELSLMVLRKQKHEEAGFPYFLEGYKPNIQTSRAHEPLGAI